MINNQKINDISELHNIYLITGDIVETPDTPQKYILIQNKFHPLINQRYTFSSQTEMLQCLYPMTGDIAEIAVSGTESETYIAVPSIDSNQNPVMEWILFDQNKVVHTYDSCYQRGDFESAARIWFDAEKRLKKNSKDYLTTMPSYFLQNLTKQH
jgi:hypothetical protein